ncbi:MAG: translocation/assembly module TamB domain-containing protein [Myxococcota bacterium]
MADAIDASVRLEGFVDRAQFRAEGALIDQRIAATLTWPPQPLDTLDARWRPSALPDATYGFNVRGFGTLTAPRVSFEGRIIRPDGRAQVYVDATADTEAQAASAKVAVSGLELGWFGADLPRGRLAASVRARATYGPEVAAEVWASVPATELDGIAVPSLDLHAHGARLDATEAALHVSLRARERPWRASLDYAAQRARLRVQADRVPLALVPNVTRGTADVALDAEVDAPLDEARAVDGDLHVAVRGFQLGSVRVPRLQLSADVKGPIAEPARLRARVRLQGRAGTPELGVHPVTVSASGSLGSVALAADLGDAPGAWRSVSLRAEGGYRPEGRFALARLDLDAELPSGARVGLDVGDAWFDPEVGFAVDRARITGAGPRAIDASVVGTPDAIRRLTLDAPDVRLARVRRAVPLDLPPMTGALSLRVTAERSRFGWRGVVATRLEGVTVAGIPPWSGALDAKLEGRDVALSADLRGGGVTLDVATENVSLAGPPTSAPSWRGATGRAHARVRADEVARVVEALVAEDLIDNPSLGVAGAATVDVIVERTGNDGPVAILAVQSPGLELSQGGRSWDPLRIAVSGHLDDRAATVHLAVDDDEGAWVRGAIRARGVAGDLLGGNVDGLRRRDLDVRLDVANRAVAAIPLVSVDGIAGHVGAEVRLRGSLDDPKLEVQARARRVRVDDIPRPLRFDAQLALTSRRARLTVDGGARRRPRLLMADLEVTGPIARRLYDPVPWSAFRVEGTAEVHQLPLRPLEPFAGVALRGRLDADAKVTWGGGEVPAAEVNVVGEQLSVGGGDPIDLRLEAEVADGRGRGDVELKQDAGGKLAMEVEMPVASDGTPRLRAGTLELELEQFDVAAVQPFVATALPVLEGELGGSFRLRPRGGSVQAQGAVTLSAGRFQIAGVGEVFEDAEARIEVKGREHIVLERLRADTLDGSIEVRGEARLDGLALQKATAEVDIDEPIPLIVSGQRVGDAQGRVEVEAKMVDAGLRLGVNVPKLEVALPRALPSGVQSLEGADDIAIGVRKKGRFRPVPTGPPKEEEDRSEAALPILVDVALQDVEVRRNTQLWAQLDGGPKIEVTDRTRVGGTIRINRGELDVQGRSFEIEPSVINFDGHPPDNPQIIATAHWDAPDGTRVYADYRGPVQAGELTLRSDPPLSQEAIISLLLFGESGIDGGEGGGASTAAKVAAGVVTAPLNQAISDLTSLDLQTKLGNRGGNDTTEVQLRIARSLSVGFAHLLGLPAPGQSPDRNFASIEWRFARKWELEATVGDAGSAALEALWRHRYR